jgi:hypothetical protein
MVCVVDVCGFRFNSVVVLVLVLVSVSVVVIIVVAAGGAATGVVG